MTVHIVISGGANELVGEIVYRALEKAGISVESWANSSEEDAQANLDEAISHDMQVAITAMVDE